MTPLPFHLWVVMGVVLAVIIFVAVLEIRLALLERRQNPFGKPERKLYHGDREDEHE